jgi:hypothetical protein
VQKANQVYYQINQTVVGNKEINSNTKKRIYKAVCLPTLLCGAVSWTVLIKHESKITGAEMRYLRRSTGKQEATELETAKLEEC